MVDFAEGGGLVNDTGAAVGRDEVGGNDAPGDIFAAAGGERAFRVAGRFVEVVERRLIALDRSSPAPVTTLLSTFA